VKGVGEASERVRVVDEEGLYWIEEPTRADDYGGHARIRAAARTAIQLGENWWGPHDMVKSVAAGASDHVMLDVMKLGGVTGWLRAAAIAEGHGLPASSHTFPEFSVHLLGVTPTCRWLEYLDHVGPILKEPVRVVNGQVLTPTTPERGLEWDEPLGVHSPQVLNLRGQLVPNHPLFEMASRLGFDYDFRGLTATDRRELSAARQASESADLFSPLGVSSLAAPIPSSIIPKTRSSGRPGRADNRPTARSPSQSPSMQTGPMMVTPCCCWLSTSTCESV